MLKYKKNITNIEYVVSPVPILTTTRTIINSAPLQQNSNSIANIESINGDINGLACDDNLSDCSDITSCDTAMHKDHEINVKNGTFHYAINFVRTFLLKMGFIECYFENKLGAIAKCNDPFTVCYYFQNNHKHILTQTNRISLELELMNNSTHVGFFSLSNCYLNDAATGGFNFIPKIEFVMKGGMYDLEKLERDMLFGLGFKKITGGAYSHIIEKYNFENLNIDNYKLINTNEGDVFFLKHFPISLSEQWNINSNASLNTTNKIIVLINGKNIIDSCENSCNKLTMQTQFNSLLNGEYANKFNNVFGEINVKNELAAFLNSNFIIRSSGEINIYNLIGSLLLHKLIPKKFLH